MGLQSSPHHRLLVSIPARTIVVLSFILLLAACGTDGPDERWDWYFMFDNDFGVVMDASPPYYTTEVPIDVTVTVLPKNSGVGYFSIAGTNGVGDPIGEVLTPAAGEFGWVSVPVVYEAWKERSLTWQVRIYQQDKIDSARLTFWASFDSVVIDSTMYSIDAPEVAYQFGYDFIHAVSGMLWLNPPE